MEYGLWPTNEFYLPKNPRMKDWQEENSCSLVKFFWKKLNAEIGVQIISESLTFIKKLTYESCS